MSKITTIVGAIVGDVRRLQNSTAGNPRFRITLDTGEQFNTKANAGFAYEVTPAWVGQRVAITIGTRGTITGATILSPRAYR